MLGAYDLCMLQREEEFRYILYMGLDPPYVMLYMIYVYVPHLCIYTQGGFII